MEIPRLAIPRPESNDTTELILESVSLGLRRYPFPRRCHFASRSDFGWRGTQASILVPFPGFE